MERFKTSSAKRLEEAEEEDPVKTGTSKSTANTNHIHTVDTSSLEIGAKRLSWTRLMMVKSDSQQAHPNTLVKHDSVESELEKFDGSPIQKRKRLPVHSRPERKICV